MQKSFRDIDDSLSVRALIRRSFFVSMSLMILLGGLDLALVLGDSPVVGAPFVSAAWAALATLVTGILTHETRRTNDTALDCAMRDFREGNSLRSIATRNGARD